MGLYDFAVQYDCGCQFFCIIDIEAIDYDYCPVHAAAQEMYGGLIASVAALEYAEHYYMPSVSATSEMWSFVNGYEGSPDIRTIIANVEERK